MQCWVTLSHGGDHAVAQAGMVVGEGGGCAGAAAGGRVGLHPCLLRL